MIERGGGGRRRLAILGFVGAHAGRVRWVGWAGVLVLGGCSASGPSVVDVPAGGYVRAFDAARRTLTDARFELDRVDARAGVITTQPKPSAGLLTFWDTTPTTMGQRVEDTVNAQRRTVRVVFEPVAGMVDADLRETQPAVRARVEVAVERLHRPGWDLDATSVRNSGFSSALSTRSRNLEPSVEVPFTRDEELAKRLAREIDRRLGK